MVFALIFLLPPSKTLITDFPHFRPAGSSMRERERETGTETESERQRDRDRERERERDRKAERDRFGKALHRCVRTTIYRFSNSKQQFYEEMHSKKYPE